MAFAGDRPPSTKKDREGSSTTSTTSALLGDIEILRKGAPSSFSHSEKSEYAEQDIVEGKPTLQYVGESLKELTLSFQVHAGWCNPDAILAQLQNARESHTKLPLIMGSGVFKGDYVIESIQTKLVQVDLNSKIVSADLQVKLKEDAAVVKEEEKTVEAGAFESPFKKFVRSI